MWPPLRNSAVARQELLFPALHSLTECPLVQVEVRPRQIVLLELLCFHPRVLQDLRELFPVDDFPRQQVKRERVLEERVLHDRLNVGGNSCV